MADPRPDVAGSTAAWVDGWTRMRGLDREDVLGCPRVLVRGRSRETETVCVDPGPQLWARLLATVAGDPRAMLTVVSHRADRYVERLPADVRLDLVDETLMDRSLCAEPRGAGDIGRLPDGLDLEVDDEPGRRTVRLVAGAPGERIVAAEGAVGVHAEANVGVATYDNVETDRRYRRRGLGRWVMGALEQYAVDAGATRGILVATKEGSALYAALGWRAVSPMRSVMGASLG